jgi:hypothetical protein
MLAFSRDYWNSIGKFYFYRNININANPNERYYIISKDGTHNSAQEVKQVTAGLLIGTVLLSVSTPKS